MVGRYVLGPEVAVGGMATVHLGRSDDDDRIVAIKRLHPPFARDGSFVRMLVDEARLVGRIHHPNVVAVHDLISADGELSLVLEYIHGETAATLLKAHRGPLPEPIAARIVVDALRGLHAAHQAQAEDGTPLHIVHRDVSPHNILVGADGVSRMLDFGVAKATVRIQTTREGQAKGKLRYMAPEQLLSGSTLDHRADLYAAAVVLWELLVGRRLFKGDNEQQIIVKILSGIVTPPSHARPDMAHWDEFFERAMASAVDGRFVSAEHMIGAIEAIVEPAPLDAMCRFIESTGGYNLGHRRELLRQFELEMAPRRHRLASSDRRRRWLLPGAALAVIVLGGLSLAFSELRGEDASAPSEDAEPADYLVVSSEPVAAPSQDEQEAPPAATSAAVAPPHPITPPKSPPPPAAPPPAAPQPVAQPQPRPSAAPAKPNCQNPFYTDSAGIRRVRRECLR
jgi:serine/threonine-protein kinase